MKKQILVALIFASCTASKEQNLHDFMINSWQTEYINIKMPTANGKDSTQVYEDNFSKKEATVAQSTYHKNGTFTAWYLKYDGSKMGETNGKWRTKGDSLFVEYTINGKTAKPSYFINKTANGFEGKSIYDWDNDGEKDDILLMKSKKINLK